MKVVIEMADTAAIANIWPVLLPVIIGGLIAAVGGAVGPIVSHFLTANSERITVRRQRFEDMVAAVYAQDHWLDACRAKMVFGEDRDIGPAPINKALSIALLHFSGLLPALRKLDYCSSAYQQWMAEAASRRISKETSSISDGFSEAYKIWAEGFRDFQEALTEYVGERQGKV